MDTSRRTLLRVGAAAGAAALAGCIDSIGDVGGDGGPPTNFSWLYDPTTLTDVGSHGFLTVDVDAIREHEEHVPEEVWNELEALDEEVENVDIEEFDHLTGVGFAGSDFASNGATVVASGSFDAAAIRAEFEADADADVLAETEWSYEGYEGYHVEEAVESWESGADDDRYQSFTVGLTDEHVVAGYVLDDDLRSDEAVETAIDTHGGDGTPYYESDDAVRALVDGIGDAEMGAGAAVDEDLLAEGIAQADPEVRDALRDLTAFGLRTALGEDVETGLVLVYADADAVSADAIESLVDDLREDPTFDDSVEDVSVAVDGRTVTVTATVDGETFWEGVQTPLQGTSTSAQTAIGEDTVEGSTTTPSVPMVSLEFDYDPAAETVTITHASGDAFDADAVSLAGDVQRDDVPGWEGEVTVGDSTDGIPLHSGEIVTVVWADDGATMVLGQFFAP
ncbi:hypothetical protein [Salinilacihabitans rarus]|uniref:hypothetical protein n=1 Tax=Salinilacihabitans rarus TaxID=2961596 RepID=UPI0020C85DC1|nr:hypothetical protein [Salinilacihabitans rarus]